MQIVATAPFVRPQVFDTYRCAGDSGTETALLCLRAGDAVFVDAALAVLMPHRRSNAGTACAIDRLLWEAGLDALPRTPSRAAVYRAAIAAVQSHCAWRHGDRFERLPAATRLQVLATVEAGDGFGGISAFPFLPAMLRADAAAAMRHASP